MSRSSQQPSHAFTQSPLSQVDLAQLGLPSEVLRMVEDPFLTHINVRGKLSNTDFKQGVESVLGVELPADANTTVLTAELSILWYGPEEWLVIAGTDRGQALLHDLTRALKDVHSQVTDISGGNTVIDISGSRARDLLKKAATIDFHPRAFSVGQCALTTFAHAGAAIYQYDDTPAYRIVVRRSFADYIGVWLLDAAQEFRV